MVSLHELWSRSLELWVTSVYKAILRNRITGLLRLLAVLSRARSFRALSYAILHCRGDRDDPLVRLLLELSRLSGLGGLEPPSANETGSSGISQQDDRTRPQERNNDEATAAVISRSILAAVTPLVLHVFLSRWKHTLRSQNPCHCYSTILRDLKETLKDSGTQFTGSPLVSKRSLTRPRYKRFTNRNKPRPHLTYRDKSDRVILCCSNPEFLLWQVNPKEDQQTDELVDIVKNSDIGSDQPPDNISGLSDMLVSICELYTPPEPREIPYSLFQLYEELPEYLATVKTRVENAIVYIQRLKSLDLEFKYSNAQMLTEATKTNLHLSRYLHTRVWGNSRPYTSSSAQKERRYQSHTENKETDRKVSHAYMSFHSPLSQEQSIHDMDVSNVVGRCLLFFSENISGFMKLSNSIRKSGKSALPGIRNRLLLLASEAMLRKDAGAELGNQNDDLLPPEFQVYFHLMYFIDALCSTQFMEITPTAMLPQEGTKLSWIVKDTLSGDHDNRNQASRPNTTKTSASPDTPRSQDPKPKHQSSRIMDQETQDGTSKTIGAMRQPPELLIAYRDQFLSSIKHKVGKRVHFSEDCALSMLRAHVTVFQLYFGHLTDAFLEMRSHFQEVSESVPAETRETSFSTVVEQIHQGKQPLTPQDSRGTFRNLMPQYQLYAYTRLVFENFSKRMIAESFLRAFWLSPNHLHRLCHRIRGGLKDVYL